MELAGTQLVLVAGAILNRLSQPYAESEAHSLDCVLQSDESSSMPVHMQARMSWSVGPHTVTLGSKNIVIEIVWMVESMLWQYHKTPSRLVKHPNPNFTSLSGSDFVERDPQRRLILVKQVPAALVWQLWLLAVSV